MSKLIKTLPQFIKQFILSPTSVGALVPSSFWLCRSMIEHINFTQHTSVAELGPGTGALTRLILDKLPSDATLDAYEINPQFIKHLQGIRDARLTIYPHSAETMTLHYDVIFSGLPLLSLPDELRQAILKCVYDCLKPGGVFVQFQYTRRMEHTLAKHFSLQRKRVLLNFPPALVYRCQPKSYSTP